MRWLALARASWIVFPVALFWLVVFPAPFVLDNWRTGLWDVDTYVWAGQALQAGDLGLYSRPAGGQKPFFYPPSFAAGWASLVALVGVRGSLTVWLAMVLGSVWAAGVLAWKESGVWAAVGSLPFLFYVVADGQVDAIMVTLIIVALWAVREEHVVLAGLLVGVAIHLKLYPVVLVPVLALRGERASCASAVLWTVALAALPTLWVGRDSVGLYGAYLDRLAETGSAGLSLGTLLSTPLLGLVLTVAFVAAYRTRNTGASSRLAVSGAILSSPVLHAPNLVNLLLLYPLIEHRVWRTAVSLAAGATMVVMIHLGVEHQWIGITFMAWGIWAIAAHQQGSMGGKKVS